MPASDLTPSNQDYLKAVWTMGEWSDEPVTSKALAQRLGHSPSTVSEALKRLTERNLVTHERYGTITLTPSGRRAALQMVRRHRLIETFLVDYLGYAWDEVHDEAEVLEHAVSERFVDRLDDRLGHPVRDPHGDPVPARDGTVPALDASLLGELHDPGPYRIARVSDADPDLLRHLTDLGVVLDAQVELVEHRGFAGTVAITLGGSALDLGIPAANAIWVVRASSPASP